MSELENSSTDEVVYEGAVQPYMFEPMAEVLPDVGRKEDIGTA